MPFEAIFPRKSSCVAIRALVRLPFFGLSLSFVRILACLPLHCDVLEADNKKDLSENEGGKGTEKDAKGERERGEAWDELSEDAEGGRQRRVKVDDGRIERMGREERGSGHSYATDLAHACGGPGATHTQTTHVWLVLCAPAPSGSGIG